VESWVERLCHVLCAVALFAMVAIVGVEVVTRNLFDFSFQVSDELGGYIIVLISFLSLCVCHANGSYHHVEFLQARLTPGGRNVSHVLFGLMCLALCLVLTWQLGRLALNSWMSEDVAPTPLLTPLWIPQSAMPLGMAALSLSLARTAWADISRLLRRAG